MGIKQTNSKANVRHHHKLKTVQKQREKPFNKSAVLSQNIINMLMFV